MRIGEPKLLYESSSRESSSRYVGPIDDADTKDLFSTSYWGLLSVAVLLERELMVGDQPVQRVNESRIYQTESDCDCFLKASDDSRPFRS